MKALDWELDDHGRKITLDVEYFRQTEGQDAADAFEEWELARDVEQARHWFERVQFTKKQFEIRKKYRADIMADWPREAWEEYTEFAVRLGHSRKDFLKQWPLTMQ